MGDENIAIRLCQRRQHHQVMFEDGVDDGTEAMLLASVNERASLEDVLAVLQVVEPSAPRALRNVVTSTFLFVHGFGFGQELTPGALEVVIRHNPECARVQNEVGETLLHTHCMRCCWCFVCRDHPAPVGGQSRCCCSRGWQKWNAPLAYGL